MPKVTEEEFHELAEKAAMAEDFGGVVGDLVRDIEALWKECERLDNENCRLKARVITLEDRKKKTERTKEFVPPTIEEVQAYIDEKGYEMCAEKFFSYFDDPDRNWHDKDGKPVKNWKLKLRTHANFGGFKPEEQGWSGPVETIKGEF